MASFDLKNSIDVRVAFNTQSISTNTTTAGIKIDTQTFESITFVMQTGAVSAGNVTPLIEESDDNTTFDAVPDMFLIGTEVDEMLDSANSISKIGYVGKKRYVRLSCVTANSANLTVSGSVILGSPKYTLVS